MASRTPPHRRTAAAANPELLDRLCNTRSTLERFQRTRCVLRLMVIYSLWSRGERSLRIMQASVPIDDLEVLNLDAFQRKQAETQKVHADQTVALRIPESFRWLLIPELTDPRGPVGGEEVRLQGQEALAVRAWRKTGAAEELFLTMGGCRLRLEIDRVPLWRAEGGAGGCHPRATLRGAGRDP